MSHRAHSGTAAVRFAVPHFAVKPESQTLVIMNNSNFKELYGSNVTRSLLFFSSGLRILRFLGRELSS